MNGVISLGQHFNKNKKGLVHYKHKIIPFGCSNEQFELRY